MYRDGALKVLSIFLNLKYSKIFFDTRYRQNFFLNHLLYKLYVDFWIYFKCDSNTKVTYLSGTPPIFKMNSYIYCCFQNANIFFKNCNNRTFFSWVLSLDFLRFVFFKIFKKNVDMWIVFSPIARDLLVESGIKEISIKYIALFNFRNKKNIKKKKYDLIYPASLLAHKNHKNLILALKILSLKNIRPKVLLTLSKNEIKKFEFINLIKKYKLDIVFKKFTNKTINRAYSQSKILIYPSLNETIGLPILEASENNLIVITSKLPYAHQFVNPNLTFNPLNPNEIANKIQFVLSNKIQTIPVVNNNLLTIKTAQQLFV